MNLRETILSAGDKKAEEVTVPEWNVTLYVRSMSGRERDAFESSLVKEKQTIKRGKVKKTRDLSLDDIRAKLVVACAVDKEGTPIFAPEDVPALSEKSAVALQRVYEVASRLNGFTEDDLEEIAKN